jgi:hypothetical protein
MFIGNIVNIVQHSHLYNSFLLIIGDKITSKFQEKNWCARRASILSQFGFIPLSS